MNFFIELNWMFGVKAREGNKSHSQTWHKQGNGKRNPYHKLY